MPTAGVSPALISTFLPFGGWISMIISCIRPALVYSAGSYLTTPGPSWVSSLAEAMDAVTEGNGEVETKGQGRRGRSARFFAAVDPPLLSLHHSISFICRAHGLASEETHAN
jgi:hypothetical protein